MNKKRQQLTLFIEENESMEIEKIRRKFNPEQFELIKSHVTLCREDEIEQLEKVLLNLEQLDFGFITVDFGDAIRFSNGKGVLIPAIGDNEPFQKLREKILQGIVETPRRHEPHITLMHPRNSTCTDGVFEEIEQCNFPKKIKFRTITLIEQEIGMKWNVLQEFKLTIKL